MAMKAKRWGRILRHTLRIICKIWEGVWKPYILKIRKWKKSMIWYSQREIPVVEQFIELSKEIQVHILFSRISHYFGPSNILELLESKDTLLKNISQDIWCGEKYSNSFFGQPIFTKTWHQIGTKQKTPAIDFVSVWYLIIHPSFFDHFKEGLEAFNIYSEATRI